MLYYKRKIKFVSVEGTSLWVRNQEEEKMKFFAIVMALGLVIVVGCDHQCPVLDSVSESDEPYYEVFIASAVLTNGWGTKKYFIAVPVIDGKLVDVIQEYWNNGVAVPYKFSWDIEPHSDLMPTSPFCELEESWVGRRVVVSMYNLDWSERLATSSLLVRPKYVEKID